jgi:hypothetical protein
MNTTLDSYFRAMCLIGLAQLASMAGNKQEAAEQLLLAQAIVDVQPGSFDAYDLKLLDFVKCLS